jgi:pimeloyl-ACP methyl ester carboxylesterase
MSNEFICVAIDGTNSRGVDYSGGASSEMQICFENKSNVRSFFDKLNIPENCKLFLHGPGIRKDRKDGMDKSETYDAVTGSTCENIANEAMSWIRKALSDKPNAKIILVGHSRGGHIATELAIRLSTMSDLGASNSTALNLLSPFPLNTLNLARATITLASSALTRNDPHQAKQKTATSREVFFLGLYDAVDMTTALGDTTIIPSNVKWVYHAMRSKEVGSRSSWGYTAIKTKKNDPDRHFFQEFGGTHGSMGGAFATSCAKGILGPCDVAVTADQNRLAGKSAHQFVMDGAKKAGLPGF